MSFAFFILFYFYALIIFILFFVIQFTTEKLDNSLLGCISSLLSSNVEVLNAKIVVCICWAFLEAFASMAPDNAQVVSFLCCCGSQLLSRCPVYDRKLLFQTFNIGTHSFYALFPFLILCFCSGRLMNASSFLYLRTYLFSLRLH